MKRKKIKEVFDIDPYQGMSCLMGIKKEGYDILTMVRKKDKVTITYIEKEPQIEEPIV